MAKIPHLHRRKGSKNYSYRRRIPTDLQDHYGKPEIKISLRTPDYSVAVQRLRIEDLRVDQDFARIRRELADTASPIHQHEIVGP